MKVYGAEICMDCRNYNAIQEKRGFSADYIDITSSTDHLKEFLKIRDHAVMFDAVREHGGIGIPLFVREDGAMTFDLNEALGWIGQPPAAEDELPEHRPGFTCASCK